MKKRQPPFYHRIQFWLLVPVVVVGIACSTLLVAFLSTPMKQFLVRQFDSNLKVASVMGLRACEESFSYLLDLRLERNEEMNQVMQSEVMTKIQAIGDQFPQIELLVLESRQTVRACSLPDAPERLASPSFEVRDDRLLLFTFNGNRVRSSEQFFPFWDWHIISFVFEDDYTSPIRMAYRITYLSVVGVFLAVVATLLVVFHLFIKKPLNRLITATEGVAEGRLYKVDRIAKTEFGRLMASFNSMIDSLEKEKTEVRRLIEQLQDSEALFRSQFEYGNIGIVITTPDKEWIRTNEQFRRIVGYSEEELHNRSWPEITHPEDLDTEMIRYNQMLAGELDSYEMEKRIFHKCENLIFIQINVCCFRNPDRSIRFVIASILDITDRKLAEQEKERLDAQLLQAQKMESVGLLAGGIAHDFNNMLSVVIGHSELAMGSLDPGNPLHRKIRTIHQAALRSADLVRQLLAFARKQTVSPKVLDINETISGMLKMLHRLIGEEIDLAWIPGQDIGRIRMDPSQVDQILANLLVNARDAIQGVGTISIETDSAVLDDGYCAAHLGFQPGRFVKLSISDNGSGMDAKILEKIFDPFFTTKAVWQGTGLGLAMVYGIVKQNEGFINVYSEVGQGTTFKIYLPVVEVLEDAVPQKAAAEDALTGTETVLLVEDDHLVLEMGQAFLEQQGYIVLTAATPEDAIALAQSYNGRIDLLMTDVVMPQMNGRELAQRLGETIAHLKCLFVSGYTENVIAHRGILDPGVHFLSKPFSMQELAAKVRDILDGMSTRED